MHLQVQEAQPGSKVSVRYKGWLAKNNQVFDQTKGSKTFNFRVGAPFAALFQQQAMIARILCCLRDQETDITALCIPLPC